METGELDEEISRLESKLDKEERPSVCDEQELKDYSEYAL